MDGCIILPEVPRLPYSCSKTIVRTLICDWYEMSLTLLMMEQWIDGLIIPFSSKV